MKSQNRISKAELARIIEECDPDTAAKSFSSSGRCGNEGLFRFCQHLKEKFYDSHKAIPFVRQWYNRWHEKLIIDKTDHKLTVEEVEVQADELWDKIKFPIGGQLANAIVNARERYDETIPELGDYGDRPEKLLALTCYELWVSAGYAKFYLSQYDAAEIMGLDRVNGQKRARLTLKVFIRKGILSVAKKGNRRRATRYYYTGSPPSKRY